MGAYCNHLYGDSVQYRLAASSQVALSDQMGTMVLPA